MRILVLGANGMLGHDMFNLLRENQDWAVFGAMRSPSALKHFPDTLQDKLIVGCDVLDNDALVRTFAQARPNVVINCVGLIKQKADAEEVLSAIPINTMLPHRLANLCELSGARLIHISTDCVFSGLKGAYTEDDPSDAKDVYGKSKFLGEVHYPHSVTLRTSIIGHQLNSNIALVDWFLSQNNACKGYKRAIFSGLPTVSLAEVVRDFVLPDANLHGLYHVAAQAISKFDLLSEIAKVYGKSIEIHADELFTIDRSLNASRFNHATGYIPPDWPTLIKRMHEFKLSQTH